MAPALWRQFTPAAGHADGIVVRRGEGCHFWDERGRRYVDALAGLHSMNVGYGPWPELVEAARVQLDVLPFFPSWFGYTTEPALRLADRLRALAPFDAGRVFFTQSGSEAIEAAMKLARQYHRLRGEPQRTKFVSRRGAYHGSTLGALSLNGTSALRNPFEPLLGGVSRVGLASPSRCMGCAGRCTLACADEVEAAIVAEGADTVAAVFLEPVQNSGGALVPPPGYAARVSAACRRHGVLLVMDETITAFGRLGTWFASPGYGFRADVVTVAKGLTSSYAPLGAMIASAEVSKPFFEHGERMFSHGSTFGGHPVSAAVATANLDIIEREDLLGHVERHAPALRAGLEALAAASPIAGEVRGDGYFLALELLKDRDSRTPFPHAERDELISSRLLPLSRELGLHVKFDDRIELAVLLTPALVAGPAEHEEIVGKLELLLDAAAGRAKSRALSARS